MHVIWNKENRKDFSLSITAPINGYLNHVLRVDILIVVDGNVLHILDVDTGYHIGCFRPNMDAETSWRMMRRRGIKVYAGASNNIHFVVETNFKSRTFSNGATMFGLIVFIAPTKAHDRIGFVVRSHDCLCTAYDKLCIDLPHIRKEIQLSTSLKLSVMHWHQIRAYVPQPWYIVCTQKFLPPRPRGYDRASLYYSSMNAYCNENEGYSYLKRFHADQTQRKYGQT